MQYALFNCMKREYCNVHAEQHAKRMCMQACKSDYAYIVFLHKLVKLVYLHNLQKISRKFRSQHCKCSSYYKHIEIFVIFYKIL